MKREIIFLGTGSSQAIPRKGHRDEVCRAARRGGRSRRTRSAAIVSFGEHAVLIDAGPDIADQLKREKITGINAVVLTHGHADAAGGLRLLDNWLHKHCPQSHLPVLTDAITRPKLLKRFPRLKHLTLMAIRPFGQIKVGKLLIKPFPVKHSMAPGFPTQGFYFGKNLAYASDVAALPEKSALLLKGVKTLVLDAAMYFGTSIPSHLATDQAIKWGNQLQVKRLVLTQIGHTYPPHEQAQKKLAKQALLAYDGLRLRF